jgi:hypothetical protein
MATTTSIEQPRTDSVPATRIAAYPLTDYLERLGVEVIFGLCGHTIIAFLDALGKSKIRFITSRHEQVAAHAADGYARATGKPGVLLTHLGPGLTNATTGVANTALDSIPMVVIAGDIPSHYALGRGESRRSIARERDCIVSRCRAAGGWQLAEIRSALLTAGAWHAGDSESFA